MPSRRRQRTQSRVERKRAIVIPLVLLFGMICSGTWAGISWYIDHLPAPSEFPQIEQTSYLYLESGKFVSVFPTVKDRRPVPLKSMDNLLVQGAIAVEDKRFWEHKGYDVLGLGRATWQTVQGNTQGGSTITQQLVRTVYPNIGQEKTLDRKLDELYTAQFLEQKWQQEYGPTLAKERILGLYLNNVYVGNGAYGMQAGARRYFARNANSLLPEQSALLIGLIQSPSGHDPWQYPEQSLARRNVVLKVWYEAKLLTQDQYKTARLAKLPVKRSNIDAVPIQWQDHVEGIEQELEGRLSIQGKGVRVYTTINTSLQTAAQKSLRKNLQGKNMPEGAVVIIENKTGAIRALASSQPQLDFSLPRQAKRQPGSSAKIWALATLIDQQYNPDKISYTSKPLRVVLPGGEVWNPQTYDHTYPGQMSLQSATTRSDNSIYAQLTLDLGPQKIAQTAQKAGIERQLSSPYSISLGGVEVTPLEQTNFYATIARGGAMIAPHLVNYVEDRSGKILYRTPVRKRQVLPASGVNIIQKYLRDNVQYGTGERAQLGNYFVAGKTGTTDDYKDAWFCGFTIRYTSCVWVGYLKPRTMNLPKWGNVSGGGLPAQIWHDTLVDKLPKRDQNKTPQKIQDASDLYKIFQPGSWQTNKDFAILP